ncbi:MAG: SDR family NAD(P)-dependent oxidoreductase, partial [Acidimicrobiia bacterium]|nr:SDR family NAD(P)-dependent oxidoreductase [Acidimicrobiia bacterium]
MPNIESSSNSVLVVGASRGIGAELVRQYLADGFRVHATVRDPAAPGELEGLAGPLVLHTLDVRDPDQTAAVAADLAGANLGIVIHNAGIGRPFPREEIMEVNAVAPIRMCEALLGAGAVRDGGVIAIMTSQMGSRRGRTGSLGNYGDSKALLNDEFRRRSTDWREQGILAIVVHPGWVRTEMGGPEASL